MFSYNIDFCVLKIELKKTLETHEQMLGRSCCPMISLIFSVVLVVLYGDVVSPIFFITLMTFFEYLPSDSCDVLDLLTTNWIKHNSLNDDLQDTNKRL